MFNKQTAGKLATRSFHALLCDTVELSDTAKMHTWCPSPSNGQPQMSRKGQKWNAFRSSLKILK